MTRYEGMFARLDRRGEGALVPFLMLGDPDRESSLAMARAVVRAGADALELGIPFSDPVADGPTIQQAAVRALEGGATPVSTLDMVREIRSCFPELPIGLLVYANLVAHPSLETFYMNAAAAGADSVLVADVPADEAEPLIRAARKAGIAPVLLLPHDADADTVDQIAGMSAGYTYVLGRAGVTGHCTSARRPDPVMLTALRNAGGAPALVGFGVSTADQVRDILDAGAAGVIVGSVLISHIPHFRAEPRETLRRISEVVRELKTATQKESPFPKEKTPFPIAKGVGG